MIHGQQHTCQCRTDHTEHKRKLVAQVHPEHRRLRDAQKCRDRRRDGQTFAFLLFEHKHHGKRGRALRDV
ncbi:hypothetical protein D1872_321630 [compost metagenome]